MNHTLLTLTLVGSTLASLPCLAGDEDKGGVVYAKRFNGDHVALFNASTGETKLGLYRAKDEDSGWVYTSSGTSFYKASDGGNGGALYSGGRQSAYVIENQNGKLTDPD